MIQLLHTPEGVRDIYNLEYQRKLILQERLQTLFRLYGYQGIQTPTFEYFDVFGKEVGTIPSKELYKFFDREGNTLVLRPDFTPSIARVAATLLEKEDLPIRLSYLGNTFVNHSSYQGRLKENTQIGAEQIGVDSIDSDAEMIALSVDCLKETGLKEFQINIGHVNYFQGLLAKAGLLPEEEGLLREFINNRNYFGVEELLHSLHAAKEITESFVALADLSGGPEVLEKAKELAPNETSLQAVLRLEAIYDLLDSYGITDYISFDLSMNGTYGYYSGVIFRGYTFGTGDAIVKGGRYDHLIEKFGKNLPSIGFAAVIDEIMNALSRQKISIDMHFENTLILYDETRRKDAVSLAMEFRRKGTGAELLLRDRQKSVEAYCKTGTFHMTGTLLYLMDTQEIMIKNLVTGEEKMIGTGL